MQGTILRSRVLDDPNAMARLSQAFAHERLSESEREGLLRKYKLTKDFDASTQLLGLLQLVSDLRFYLPVLKVTEGWSGRRLSDCHRYHIHQVSDHYYLYPRSKQTQLAHSRILL
jgi:hypothetical protein